MTISKSGIGISYQVNPLTIIHTANFPDSRGLVIEVADSINPLIIKDWKFAWAISSLPESFTYEQALGFWDAKLGFEISINIWEIALEELIIIPTDSNSLTLQRFEYWKKYSWQEASIYHESTRDFPFLQMSSPQAFKADDQRMLEFSNTSSPPDIYQEFPSTFSLPLRKFSEKDDLDSLVESMSLESRRGLDGISLLLDICFGERGKISFNIQGEFLLKSVPSGGARHPTEIFLAFFNESHIEEGIYHYNVKKHSLDCIKEGNFYDDFENATFDLFKKFIEKPMGLVIFTTLYERAMWRYRDSRSWRALPIDLGHAIMAFRTVSHRLGLGTYTYQKFKDHKVNTLLGINPFEQTPLYIGTLI